MTTNILNQVIRALTELSDNAGARDAQSDARRLTDIIAPLEAYALNLMLPVSDEPSQRSIEERQYYRAIEDLSSLMVKLAEIQQVLINKEEFVETMKRKGHDLDSMRNHLRFTEQLDTALESLINLIQYDEPERHPWSIKNGYQFKSGSMSFGRYYFGTGNEGID